MVALCFALFVFLISIGSGWTIVAAIDRERKLDPFERLPTAFAAGMVTLYLLCQVVGPFRLDKLSVSIMLALVAALATPSAWRALRHFPRHGLERAVAIIRHHRLASLLWLVVILSALSLVVQGMAPPNDYDSLFYHLALPKADTEQGFIGANWGFGSFSFFPALSEHLYRVALVMVGETAAQPLTGLFGPMLAVATAAAARRLKAAPWVAALAALMTLWVRATVWELATCEVEAQMAFFAATSLLLFHVWKTERTPATLALLLSSLVAGVLVKYHGLVLGAAFFALVVVTMFRSGTGWAALIRLAPLSALLALPHAARNLWYTGNPIYPILNSVFNPGAPDPFAGFAEVWGRGRSLTDLLLVPWDISVLPTYHHDGAMLGAPYLLAFAPLVLLRWQRSFGACAVVILAYGLAWFYGMSQQVRFLVPITPYLSILAAMGVAAAWDRAPVMARAGLAVCGAVLLLNQSLFVGVYALLRLPPALGLQGPAQYLAATPTMGGTFYQTCRYVDAGLKPGETVLSLIEPHSYYCPQTRAIRSPALPGEEDYWFHGRPLPEISPARLADVMEAHKVRFVIVETLREFRRGEASAPEIVQRDLAALRLGRPLKQALLTLEPEFSDGNSAVYDARRVLPELRRIPPSKP